MAELTIGAYKVLRLIGKGGMGRVYEAVNEQIQRRVAIKVLHAEFADNPEVIKRFLNEARAVNIVRHRCLVDAYEFGQMDDGSAYMVMEFLEGETLYQRLKLSPNRRFEVGDAVRFARQIALALAAAHSKGVVHRDLKPANVMLIDDPETGARDWIKVLDFGLAKLKQPDEEHGITKTGTLMGTISYMSPEQCRSARGVTDRGDIYTLGIMLYEMLAGRVPFKDESDMIVMSQHMNMEPPPLQRLMPSLPPSLSALVHRMLSKAATDRPSAAEVASALLVFEKDTAGGVPSPLAGTGSGPHPGPVEPSNSEKATVLQAPGEQPGPVSGNSLSDKATVVKPTGDTASGTGTSTSSLKVMIIAVAVLLVIAVAVGVMLWQRYHAAVRWSIQSAPPGAEVLNEDGQTLGFTPLQLEQQKRPQPQSLVLRLAGHLEEHITCPGDQTCVRAAVLMKQPPPPPPPPPVVQPPPPPVETPPPAERPAKPKGRPAAKKS